MNLSTYRQKLFVPNTKSKPIPNVISPTIPVKPSGSTLNLRKEKFIKLDEKVAKLKETDKDSVIQQSSETVLKQPAFPNNQLIPRKKSLPRNSSNPAFKTNESSQQKGNLHLATGQPYAARAGFNRPSSKSRRDSNKIISSQQSPVPKQKT